MGNAAPRTEVTVAGVFAREQGALAPARLIASAKSWLVEPRWTGRRRFCPGAPRTSRSCRLSTRRPASSRISATPGTMCTREIQRDPPPREAGDRAHGAGIVRRRSARADRPGGATRRFVKLILLEEPLAALYAWMAAHRRACRHLRHRRTRPRLRRRRRHDGLQPDPRRVDEEPGSSTSSGSRSASICCSAATTSISRSPVDRAEARRGGEADPRSAPDAPAEMQRRQGAAALGRRPGTGRITILGAGRGVVAGGLSTTMTRDDVIRTLTDGFLPITAAADLPARDRRPGFASSACPTKPSRRSRSISRRS